ncbi:Uridine-cytidine kinase-like 1, partial [Kappamyces sp. JEL0680]
EGLKEAGFLVGGLSLGDKAQPKHYSVTIVRGGMPLTAALQKEIPKVLTGTFSIASSTSDPILKKFDLPHIGNISRDGTVFLMDDQIATGATALMAIRILLDHHIPEEGIIFCTLVASALGLSNIHRAFPAVRIVTGSIVDYQQESKGSGLVGGFGKFSQRYFGTQ